VRRELLHHLRACQVVAVATANNDMNGAFLHNAFGMEQGVALIKKFHMQERGEHIPPEGSFDVARRIKEMHCYTSSDIVKVLITSTDFFLLCVLIFLDQRLSGTILGSIYAEPLTFDSHTIWDLSTTI
jgi:hypothetical protein